MLLKIMGIFIICIGSWYVGKCFANTYDERIYLIEDYIIFTQSLKSAIGFSGMTLYNFFKKDNGKYTRNFSTYCISSENNVVTEAKKYKADNAEEKECVKMLVEVLVVAEKSNDIQVILDIAEEVISKLTLYKNIVREEYCGKIKTMPKLGLITGLFVAVLVL